MVTGHLAITLEPATSHVHVRSTIVISMYVRVHGCVIVAPETTPTFSIPLVRALLDVDDRDGKY